MLIEKIEKERRRIKPKKLPVKICRCGIPTHNRDGVCALCRRGITELYAALIATAITKGNNNGTKNPKSKNTGKTRRH